MLIRREGTVWRYCLATCYSLQSTCYLLLATCCSLLTTHHSPLTTHYSLLTTHYSLTAHYSLLTTRYSLHTTHYLLLTIHCLLLTTHYLLLTNYCSLPTAHHRSIGRLTGRYAATLVSSIPLSEAEVKLQRWLVSPIFARNPDGCVPLTPKQIAGYVAATAPPFFRSRDADGKRTDKAVPPESVQLLISHTPQELPYSYLLLTAYY